MDSFFPDTAQAVVNILHRQGLNVDFAVDQTCCGQPPYNAGLHTEARGIAEHTIRVFENTTGDIVTPSGSCAYMLKHNYPDLFDGDPVWQPRASALADRVFEFTEYLVDRLKVSDVGARWDGMLTYHPACHTLRGMGIDRQPRLLLSHVRDAKIVELPHAEECCGFGGIFSMEHPELSMEMLKRKIGNLEASASPTLVIAEAGCLMHITGGLHRLGKTQRVMHIAEILDSH